MKPVVSLLVVLFSSQVFAGACFTDMGIASVPKSCAEYSSSDAQVMEMMEDSCEASPYNTWVSSCSGARLGCKVDQGSIVTTIWYINNEPRDAVDYACSAVQGIVITK